MVTPKECQCYCWYDYQHRQSRWFHHRYRKKGCEHVKSLAQTEATLSTDDIKDPSPEASVIGGKFFSDIWDNDGREMAQEIIQKSEKGIHDARKVAEAAEKSTEPEGQIGIN